VRRIWLAALATVALVTLVAPCAVGAKVVFYSGSVANDPQALIELSVNFKRGHPRV
jgi:hypothetical protein